MRAYRAFFAARFRTLLQYRGAALGGMVTQVFFGLIMVMVYEAFFRSTAAAQPMTIAQVRSYVWLGQAFLAMLPWNAEPEQRQLVRTGAVAYELLRPVQLYALWFARALAWRTAPTVLRAAPILAVSLAFFGLSLPASPAAAGAWLCAMAGALLLSAAMTTLLTILLLWTVTGDGLNILFTSLVVLFSGMNIPVPLFPDWARGIVEALPFRGLVDTPYRLYVGYAPPSEVGALLLQQLAWTAGIIGASILLLGRGLRRVEVMGG